MRRSVWTRVLAVVLVIAMLAAPVSAATSSSYGTNGSKGSLISIIRDIIREIWDDWFNGPGFGDPTDPTETTAPEETTAPTEPEETTPEETEPEKVMSVVEHQSNTDNGSLLRATTYSLAPVSEETVEETNSSVSPYALSTYALSTADVAVTADETTDTETMASGTTVKYFPVTMFNYDGATINAATDLLDGDTTVREGLYFSNGGNELSATYETESEGDLSAFVDGDYYIQNLRAKDTFGSTGNVWLYYNANGSNNRKINSTTQANATVWTLTNKGDDKVTLTYDVDGTTYYMTVGDATSDVTTTYTELTLEIYSVTTEGVQILGSEYLCQFGGTNVTEYGGYEQSNDTGNGMAFYPVASDGTVSTSPITTGGTSTTVLTAGYERWNWWSYNVSGNTEQNKFYTGLVQNTLLDDQIVFNVLEGGIFNTDANVKDIYEYVGLPFVLNEDGYYTFNSDDNGVFFSDTDNDGAANPTSGTSDNAYNLYFDEGNPQGWTGMTYGDGSSNLWAPYNTNANDTGEDTIDYHFGMRADIPFSMTPNGRVKSTDSESAAITFNFAGDDDVWIYIDGVLVIDLGGIHNRIGATIDFAANTITYYRPDSNKQTLDIGSYNTPDEYPLNDDGEIVKKLFNDADGNGVINMSRDAFAADIDHEMQVFYLERGKGTSNCAIEFNLPMKDEVIVTKDATKSWSEAAEKADLAINPDDPDAGVDDLTAAEQAIINNIDFGFTLYKKTSDEDATFTPVANTNFYREGANITSTTIGTTDENGHFYLKNGESARFITDIPAEGVTYYVVEDTVPDGFITPDFNFAGTATGGFDWTDGTTVTHVANASAIPEQVIDTDATTNKSYEVTVKGSIESTDTIKFICSNYLDAELPNPTALAYEDIIVIDYGLPVDIDPLANDVFRGDDIEIVYFGNETVTLTETTGADGIVTATWSGEQTFDFGTVTFNDKTYNGAYDDNGNFVGERDTFTYTLTEQLTEVEVLTYIIKVTGSDTQDATSEKLEQYDYAIGKVYIVPATIMYYEENFSDLVTFTGSNWQTDLVETAGSSSRQEPGVVGTVDDSTYGSDVAYLNDSYDSNGTSKYADTTNGAVRFQYTFTGTGTSIFARTAATTGYVQIKLYEGTDTSGEYINLTYRDTYWKDENNTELDSKGTLYNVPIYTESNLDYGTYTVVATVAKAGTKTDGNVNGSGKDFYLDGIRIMQPLNIVIEQEEQYDDAGNLTQPVVYDALTTKALGAYATDGESNLDVVTLRQKLITDAQIKDDTTGIFWDNENFVVLTDINGEIKTAETYTSIGPKEEVYLAPGQKVSFSLKYWQTEGLKLYMGMKAPFGSAALKIGQSTYNLANTVDCYYDVTTNYSSLVTREEQGVNADGYLLYQDANGNVYYLSDDGNYYDADNHEQYTGSETLSDYMVSYYVVTYTFEATDSIVSLTNIKVVGNYEFTIVENIDENVSGDEGGDVVIDGSEA